MRMNARRLEFAARPVCLCGRRISRGDRRAGLRICSLCRELRIVPADAVRAQIRWLTCSLCNRPMRAQRTDAGCTLCDLCISHGRGEEPAFNRHQPQAPPSLRVG